MQTLPRIAALVGLSLLAGATAAYAAAVSQKIHVDLTDNDGNMMIATSSESVHAGKITFDVTNRSSDLEHEFLVARLSTAPDSVPYIEAKAVIDEHALKNVKELGDLKPGKSGEMTMTLKAGKYLMFCNLPGHFKEGMYHVLTVTP